MQQSDTPMNGPCVTVLLCADGPYFQHAGVTIASMLRANPARQFRIFVCSQKREPAAEGKLCTVAQRFGNAAMEFVEFSLEPFRNSLHADRTFTIAVYLRLFLTEFLDRSVEKVLYLDCDVVVRGDLEALWQTDLGEAMVAAVPEPSIFYHAGFGPESPYFNSGVMLIDVARWRSANILPEFVQYARENPRLEFVDQDILNQTLRGKFKPLDYRWNFFSIYPDLPASAFHMNTAEFEEVRRRPSIIHFVSIYKPWFYRWEPHYKKLYSEALAFTPWRGYRPPDRTAKSIVLKTIKMKRLKARLSWHAPGLARGLRQVLGIKT